MKQKCRSCESIGDYGTMRVKTDRTTPYWYCNNCGWEDRLSEAQLSSFKEKEVAKIIPPKNLQEEKEPEVLWHKVTLLVPQAEGESTPEKWDWQDLVGCMDRIKVVSCELTDAPAKEAYVEA